MKNKLYLSILFFVLGLSILSAGTVQKTFSFGQPVFTDRDSYQQVYIEGLNYLTLPGNPQLPSLSVQMLLPPGEEAVAVEIELLESEVLPGTYNIYPSQKPYPLNYSGKITFDEPNAIYDNDALYPPNLTTELTTNYLCGHAVALFNLYPLQYNPRTNEINFYRNIQVTVRTQTSAEAQKAYDNFYRADNATNERLSQTVCNQEIITYYPNTENSRDINDYEYVIVTSDQYLSTIEEFVAFKTGQGYHVFTKTTADIYSEYTGTDNADKIRNFIIDAYQNMGTQYVLLAGDISQVPHRGFWIDANGTEDYSIPSELYYGGLDRVGNGTGPDWNVDGDNRWGEPAEADFLTEVHVGRISADSVTELAAAINKQITYENAPVVSQLENALMVGEQLNDAPVTYGGNYKDEIVNGGSYNGYYTTGIGANFSIETLYERDGYWGVEQLQNHMNSGLNFINHLGHSNTDYNMKFYNSTVNNQTITANGIDNNFFLIYSQGCLPAAIDTDCIAEKFTTIDNGCAVFVGNTRYGWYMPGGTNSSSQYLDRHFWGSLFDNENFFVSSLNDASKEVNAAACSNDPYFRWSYYCVIVLGEPTLDIWSATPTDITATFPAGVPIGSSEVQFTTDAPYARIALLQNDELIGRAVADEFGNATVETFVPITGMEEITVSIIAHNMNRLLDTIYVISDQPYIVFDSYQIDDSTGNGNGEPDYGENIDLDMTLNNLGNQTATTVTAVISTTDEYVTLTNDTALFGDMIANATVSVAAAFNLDIADNIPDQHEVDFILEATGNEDETWTSDFSLVLNAPEFGIGSMIVNDSSGNNNGILDPGETATFIITTENSGHADSPEGLAVFVSGNSLVTVENPSLTMGSIPAQGSCNMSYTITADASIEIGTIVEFTFVIYAGSYEYETTFEHQLGLIVENFESGDFTSYPWEFSGGADWQISSGAYEGSFCAQSGSIGDSNNSTLLLDLDVVADGQISFWRTVSSEANYDYLEFYIDNTLQEEWSGDVTWEQESYDISAGTHTVKWVYSKDQGVTGGTDCARIDYIIFPSLGVIFPPLINIEPNVINVEMPSNATSEEFLEISNIGGEILNYSIITTNSPAWLEIDPLNGSLAAGEMDTVTLSFDTTGMSGGAYLTGLLIYDGIGGQRVVAVNLHVTETENNNELIPAVTALIGNYPNPFNPTTTINFGLSVDSKVNLTIYNTKGQKVKTLLSQALEAGYHHVTWNGQDEYGKQVSSGIYFYEMDAASADYVSIKKMVILK
ncbi:MAG TPA: C25 family cysteine peptidase [Candidatus Cloacimonadota bacterium]|nr:C25 family cysteine peptidase [Candidatus Cloacimonadota bacterium]